MRADRQTDRQTDILIAHHNISHRSQGRGNYLVNELEKADK